MKAHRLKLKLTSNEELRERFDSELNENIYNRIQKETSGEGILRYWEYKERHGQRIRDEERQALLLKWKMQGLPTVFKETYEEQLIKKFMRKG